MFRMGGIIIQCVRTLDNDTLDGVKIAENKKYGIIKVNDIIEIKIISTIITDNLVIYTLFLIAIVVFVQKSERWIDKIQALVRIINENKKNS